MSKIKYLMNEMEWNGVKGKARRGGKRGSGRLSKRAYVGFGPYYG